MKEIFRWIWEGQWVKTLSVRSFFIVAGLELLSALILGGVFLKIGIPDLLSVALALSLCWLPAAGYLLFKKISS